MANHKSALKRVRQSEKRRVRNKSALSQMRTAIKKFRALLGENKMEEAKAALPGLYSAIDRSEKKGVVHDNATSRYKSHLTRALNQANRG